VDVGGSVDTDITVETLPAIENQTFLPTRHEIRHEVITKETHNHDIYHRVLPVVATKVLPTKHYVHGEDGKSLVEIPEADIHKYAVTGQEAHSWHIAPGPAPSQLANDVATINPTPDDDDSADFPVVALARGAVPKTRPRGSSIRSIKSTKSNGSRTKNIFEPVLASKKEHITGAGHPRTDYVWHHPPVAETSGRTGPIYKGAGLGDLSGQTYSSDEDEDLAGAEFGAVASERGIFRDTGLGAEGLGILPGLGKKDERDERLKPRSSHSMFHKMGRLKV